MAPTVETLPVSTPSTNNLTFVKAFVGAEPIILKFAPLICTALVPTVTCCVQNAYCDAPAFMLEPVAELEALKTTDAPEPETIVIIAPCALAAPPLKAVIATAIEEAGFAPPAAITAVAAVSAFTEITFEPFTAMFKPLIVVVPLMLKAYPSVKRTAPSYK